ncbi:MAG: NAD(P)H-dependent oxidoreductase [Candidatus Zixiibacteriota bacterium]
MIRILSISGSPVPGSSTEILLERIAASLGKALAVKSRHVFVRLSDYDIAPCQACGEAPTPRYCFIDDAMTELYEKVEECDCLLFGSPIYFDSVSAQAKIFIDRCNCVRPYNFDRGPTGHHFIRLLHRTRPGAIVLVGGEKGWFEGARRCIAGFFKWIEVTNEACLKFHSLEDNKIGEARERPEALREADEIGQRLAEIIERQHGRR